MELNLPNLNYVENSFFLNLCRPHLCVYRVSAFSFSKALFEQTDRAGQEDANTAAYRESTDKVMLSIRLCAGNIRTRL